MVDKEPYDPTMELIQAVFNNTGYKSNFKKIAEAVSSGNE